MHRLIELCKTTLVGSEVSLKNKIFFAQIPYATRYYKYYDFLKNVTMYMYYIHVPEQSIIYYILLVSIASLNLWWTYCIQ